MCSRSDVCFFTIVVVYLMTIVYDIDGRVLSAYVLPHGGIALDPRYFNTTNHTAKEEAWVIHRACVKVGNEISKQIPDLILLSTPHGIADSHNFVFYLNSRGSGYADTDNCKCPPCCYKVETDMAGDIAIKLAKQFGYSSNVTGLSAYGPPGNAGDPFPLKYGYIKLLFMSFVKCITRRPF